MKLSFVDSLRMALSSLLESTLVYLKPLPKISAEASQEPSESESWEPSTEQENSTSNPWKDTAPGNTPVFGAMAFLTFADLVESEMRAAQWGVGFAILEPDPMDNNLATLFHPDIPLRVRCAVEHSIPWFWAKKGSHGLWIKSPMTTRSKSVCAIAMNLGFKLATIQGHHPDPGMN